LPSRATLMQIANYLECSLGERNDVLLAAQYLPEQPAWEGDTLRQALGQCQQTMETLPYPAIVVTHTFQVLAANAYFLHLMELPPLETLPSDQRTIFHFLLNPDCHARSLINTEMHTTWQKHVMYALHHFKQQNEHSQYDDWYQQSIQRWCDEIADFQEYWEKAQEETQLENAPTKLVSARMTTTGELLPIRVRHMLVSVSSKVYPAVSALLPVDEAARAVYASFGSVVP
jgi:MmyB-like transcription regulator ligand binding domain